MISFPPCLVINLDRDRDRLAHMEREAAEAGIEFVRFSALRGDVLPQEFSNFFAEPSGANRSLLSKGEIGCYASHLAICKMIVDGALSAPALVLEDDVDLSATLVQDIRSLLEALPKGWDIARLSNPTKHAYATLAQLENGRRLVRYSVIPDSTGAILWSEQGAAKFYKAAQRSLAVDQDLRRPWVWALDTYGVAPAPVGRDAYGQSTIDDMAGKEWRSVLWRKSEMRAWQSREMWARHRHGVATFGLGLWLHLLWINLSARAVKKRNRLAYIERRCPALRPPQIASEFA